MKYWKNIIFHKCQKIKINFISQSSHNLLLIAGMVVKVVC